ncbi:hypothetical protein [Shewanella inventionis]|uniref:Uncharacterized protein n=1 Tax=Shewanella inventionis TaxID=1738770 RepID=A0ABQ1JTB8_9GAMM|nr:hypothetical protein [Shewanella inventionis]MCL1160105.1 hypothetical protein [Shewanella inventionis]GGB77209.1 hypothetical protein GCM10011607_41760 [Shewanella inventionis]
MNSKVNIARLDSQLKQARLHRSLVQTAKAVGFDTSTMADIMNEIANSVDSVITKVNSQLPKDFPVHIRDTILDGLKDRSRRLLK